MYESIHVGFGFTPQSLYTNPQIRSWKWQIMGWNYALDSSHLCCHYVHGACIPSLRTSVSQLRRHPYIVDGYTTWRRGLFSYNLTPPSWRSCRKVLNTGTVNALYWVLSYALDTISRLTVRYRAISDHSMHNAQRTARSPVHAAKRASGPLVRDSIDACSAAGRSSYWHLEPQTSSHLTAHDSTL